MAVGNKFQREDDLRLSSLLYFSRYYNSQAATTQHALGANWTHSYSRVVKLPQGDPAAQIVNVGRPDGRWIAFAYAAGEWKPDADIAATLVRHAGPAGELLGWTFTSQDSREVEEYDALGRLLRITTPDHSAVDLVYNNGVIEGNENDFRLTRVQAEDGRSLVFEYDVARRINKITDSSGGTYVYGYDTVSNLVSVTYPDAKSRTYLYNEPSYTFATDLPSALTGIVREDGQRFATFAYGPGGKAVSTEHAGGVEKVSVQYNADGTSTVTGSLGQVQGYAFSTVLGVKKPRTIAESCVGCTTRARDFTFDANGHLDGVTDARGSLIDHDYNSRGLEIQRIESANDTGGSKRVVQTDWHGSFSRSPVERRTYDALNALVAKQTWTYNGRGQVVTSTRIDPAASASRATSTTYCEPADVTAGACPLLGVVTAVNGPRTDVNDVTTYTYYSTDDASCASSPTTCPHRKGDLWKVTDALGNVTETLAYNGAGRPLSVKDANGVVTDLEYHTRGWLTARKVRGTNTLTETDDQITRIEYYPTGLVKKTTLPDGSSTSYTYDPAQRLTRITDGEGNYLEYTLDNAGNRLKEETHGYNGTLVRQLTRVYNALGELTKQLDAESHETDLAYDANGNTDTVTDGLGRVSENTYDPLDRLTQTIQNVGGLNVATQFQYDAQDNLTQVTDPKGLDTKYTYNGFGDLTRLESPDTGVTIYTYDSAGNRKTQTDARGVTATYTYDALNRLLSVSYPDNAVSQNYTWDAVVTDCPATEQFHKGRLAKLKNGPGTTFLRYCYDRFGNVTRQLQTVNARVFTTKYTYTKSGQLSSLTYPDGSLAEYSRDALGRTNKVEVTRPGGARQTLLTSASYYPFGPAQEWVFGTGANARLFKRSLNENYQPGFVEDAASGGLKFGYEFDAVGNLVTLRNSDQSNPPKRTYAYDALNRLTGVTDGATLALQEAYTYDATGNRLSATDNGVTSSYTYPVDSHRLSGVGSLARTYDAVGNTTTIGGAAREFVYSDANRMSAVRQNGVVTASYEYNGKGEQVRRLTGTSSTYFVYDEGGHLIGEYDTTGAPVQQFVWMDDLPVGLLIGTASANQPLHYIQADALGTPRRIIDSVRNVAVWNWPLVGEAFGTDAPIEDADGNGVPLVFNLRFPGQRYDAATGLSYNYFRDYDASVGRYAESDPIGLAGGSSTFLYGSGSPTTTIDPFGLVGCVTVFRLPFVDIQQCSVPAWVPLRPGVTHPEHYEVDDALRCSTGSDCARLAMSIEILLLDLRFRRWDMQRNAVRRNGFFDPKHIERYRNERDALAALVRAAKSRPCPYNPDADREITLGPRYPTPRYN